MKNRCLKAYIAAPFFNDEQVKRVIDVENLMIKSGINFFSPRKSNLQGVHTTNEGRKAIFLNNLQMMDRADFVVVITNGKDMGTIFEAGYMYAKNKNIIYYFENDDNLSLNLMLSQSADFVATSKEELKLKIDKYIQGQFYDYDIDEISNNRGENEN